MPSPVALDPIALTEALVAVDSRNPSLVPNAPGEQHAAELLADVLHGWGFQVTLQQVAPDRANVVARIGPTGVSPLVLNGHLDVVGTDGMVHPPFTPMRRDGKLFARGATDMKGGVAAMCVAAARAAQHDLAAELIVAAVCDEEYRSMGTAHLVQQGLHATAAIVTEPTRCTIAPAHKGFVWFDVTVHGRAAHGSRPDVGRDAIVHAGRLLAAMHAHEQRDLFARSHPLLGHPSVHASTITGGSGWSTYPEQCAMQIERRTIPGETADDTVRELDALIRDVLLHTDGVRIERALHTVQPPNDVPVDAPVVQAVAQALAAHGHRAHIDGLSCWTDAALFTAAGIPAICFGPGDLALAHAAEEWVEERELLLATQVLETVCRQWGRAA